MSSLIYFCLVVLFYEKSIINAIRLVAGISIHSVRLDSDFVSLVLVLAASQRSDCNKVS